MRHAVTVIKKLYRIKEIQMFPIPKTKKKSIWVNLIFKQYLTNIIKLKKCGKQNTN
jgi:hypothetical protein